jgi:hypothetical protein
MNVVVDTIMMAWMMLIRIEDHHGSVLMFYTVHIYTIANFQFEFDVAQTRLSHCT